MLRLRKLALVSLVALSGCRIAAAPPVKQIAADRSAVPPNTVMLSDAMRDLSAQPGFTERLLDQINRNSGRTDALLTPRLFNELRKVTLGKDWGGLDRFPGWTMRSITQTVKVADHLVKQNGGLEGAKQYLDLGPYAADQPGTEDLDTPSNREGFKAQTADLGNDLGSGIVYGDGADPKLAPLHGESQRLAEVLNRLSLNGSGAPQFTASIGGQTASTPEQLIVALAAAGNSVVVADARYFANFGHMHYGGRDVEMPFWIDTGWLVPRDHWWQPARHLLLPVAHAEYEWIIDGPKLHADVTYYFGIDGKAEFRTNDEQNQTWVMGRHAHAYRGTQAVEVTRLTGHFVRAYALLHAAHPDLPFGGYYTLGVCQDSVGAIEMRMTGATTLFPNTARTELFHDQPDAEITQLMEAIPKDIGTTPTPERIFGSLPAPTETAEMAKITIPGLRADVERSVDAWHGGRLREVQQVRTDLSVLGMAIATVLIAFIVYTRSAPRRR